MKLPNATVQKAGNSIHKYAFLAGSAVVALSVGAATLSFSHPEYPAITVGVPDHTQQSSSVNAHTSGTTIMNAHADAHNIDSRGSASGSTHTEPSGAQSSLTPADDGVSVHLKAPTILEMGKSTRVAYHLTSNGAPLTDVAVSHEQEMHLIVVRQDLAVFQHVHPSRTQNPGEYQVDLTFPAVGTYVLYDEFTRLNGQDIVQRDELVVGKVSGAAMLTEDHAPKTVTNDARVSLTGGQGLRAGQAAELVFHIDNPQTGEAVRDLRPYLGAPAHVVILDEANTTFAHTHGEAIGEASSGTEHGGGHGGHDSGGTTYGPEIAFHHTFPAPGFYKIWGQFLDHHDNVVTADFVIRISE